MDALDTLASKLKNKSDTQYCTQVIHMFWEKYGYQTQWSLQSLTSITGELVFTKMNARSGAIHCGLPDACGKVLRTEDVPFSFELQDIYTIQNVDKKRLKDMSFLAEKPSTEPGRQDFAVVVGFFRESLLTTVNNMSDESFNETIANLEHVPVTPELTGGSATILPSWVKLEDQAMLLHTIAFVEKINRTKSQVRHRVLKGGAAPTDQDYVLDFANVDTVNLSDLQTIIKQCTPRVQNVLWSPKGLCLHLYREAPASFSAQGLPFERGTKAIKDCRSRNILTRKRKHCELDTPLDERKVVYLTKVLKRDNEQRVPQVTRVSPQIVRDVADLHSAGTPALPAAQGFFAKLKSVF